jgi:DNA mismatch repair ATPase MutS
MTHPLVGDCVKNSLTMDGKSVLLTGSNMSGKSTFIRAIGVNVLMAQNLLIAFADHFELSNPLHIHTVMNVHDDLLDSKSLFFSEVLAIKDLLNSSQSGNQLFLMDEMFKGTNTIERVAAANGVLSYLAEKNMVVVATHDVELTELLADKYELYHFCEQVNDGRIYFDYSLKKGVITEFNALKILKFNEYPQEVLDKAYSTIINSNCL